MPIHSPISSYLALQSGNTRFYENRIRQPLHGKLLREKLAVQGQNPLAIVLTCSDSRVAPEIILDLGLGDLFAIRIAGNIAGHSTIHSIEFAFHTFKCPTILILGHTDCGAINAACISQERTTTPPRTMQTIFLAIDRCRHKKQQLLRQEYLDAISRENVFQQIRIIRQKSYTIREAMRMGKVCLIGGLYNIYSGVIEWLKIDSMV